MNFSEMTKKCHDKRTASKTILYVNGPVITHLIELAPNMGIEVDFFAYDVCAKFKDK